jgi:hypothetical protein
MLGHFYALISDDSRALSILNDAESNSRAVYGEASVIACHCKYHLGVALFITKNTSAALECLLPLTDTTVLPGADVKLLFGYSISHVFSCFS